MITTCLTYEQLQAYSTHTVKTAERERLYMHISSCELCACAVNGFAALPFASDEVVAIHREIDARTNATAAAHSLTPAQVLIMIISFISIAGVYMIADHPAKNTTALNPAAATPAVLISPTNETKNASAEEISAVTKTFKKIVNVIQYKKFDRNITPVEQLEMIKPAGIATLQGSRADADESDDMVAPHYDENVIYIYDLKVSDYDKLYFNFSAPEIPSSKTHIPVSQENKTSVVDEMGEEQQSVAADRVLKDGLASFNKQEFGKAIEDFNLLLENNPKDVNARFYSALAYYNMNKATKAMEALTVVMQNSNQAFYPEAQWYLALVTLKTADKEKAKQMLQTIVAEKGFYSKKAKEKLKTL